MIDPVALEKAAEALANQVAMHNGSPPIINILALMSPPLRDHLMRDVTVCIEAYLEAAKPAAGWKLVPIEPTPEMVFALGDLGDGYELTTEQVVILYKEILCIAAAPDPTP